jgi:ParB/RepB/Spo0J family partition protein
VLKSAGEGSERHMIKATTQSLAVTNGKARIDDIKIGKRHRRALGDIASLGASIGEVGLLHPIVVSPSGQLIAGARRLEACKLLGWSAVPVRTISLENIVLGEAAEQFQRKDFTPSEAVAMERALEPILKKAAGIRMRGGRPLDNLAKGRAKDKIAEVIGRSRHSIEKAKAIVEAAEAEPENYRELVDQMDRTGRINGAYRRLQSMRKAEAIRSAEPPLPGNGPYGVIVIDPPWRFEVRENDPSHQGSCPYPTMSLEEIRSLNVPSIAADDALLWLWITNSHLPDGFLVLESWGFQYKTLLTWVKDKMGVGNWLRGRTEQCMLAIRGRPTVQLTNQSTVISAPTRAHSQKPNEFYTLVEQLCPAASYAELFARTPRENWDSHGSEIGSLRSV